MNLLRLHGSVVTGMHSDFERKWKRRRELEERGEYMHEMNIIEMFRHMKERNEYVF